MQLALITFVALLGCSMVAFAAPAKKSVKPEDVLGTLSCKDSTIHNQRSKSIRIHRKNIYIVIFKLYIYNNKYVFLTSSLSCSDPSKKLQRNLARGIPNLWYLFRSSKFLPAWVQSFLRYVAAGRWLDCHLATHRRQRGLPAFLGLLCTWFRRLGWKFLLRTGKHQVFNSWWWHGVVDWSTKSRYSIPSKN